MLYSGQEVGEPADGGEGFGRDDGRSSIFDYWSMPELLKWINEYKYDGARLSPEQKALRESYGRLLALVSEPAFRDGNFFTLNPGNNRNPNFGQTGSEPAGGHWLYAFLRFDPVSRQRFLVAVNLNPKRRAKGQRDHVFARSGRVSRFGALTTVEFTAGNVLRGKQSSSPTYRLLPLPTGSRFRPLLPLTAYFFEIHCGC